MTLFKKSAKLIAILVLSSALFTCLNHNNGPAQAIEPLCFKSATELTRAIRHGEVTSLELLNRYVKRIAHHNGGINAVVAMDLPAARQRAMDADKLLAQGKVWGPLHGLPMTVKDLFEVVGMPATSGDTILKEHIPKHNAIAVQRLIDAGAIIFGKTNVPYHAMDIQSYNEVCGTTNNPWDLSRTPGGSSGGSGAALAAGFTPLELGSDIGGSIRFPAHYNGVFGHKPTFGIVPRYGHIPPMPGQLPSEYMPAIPLFVVGPLARSAGDLELALDVLTNSESTQSGRKRSNLLPARRDRFSDYRVAVWFEDAYHGAEIDAEVSASLQLMLKRLRDAGLEIDEAARPGILLQESATRWLEIYDQMQMRALPLAEVLIARLKRQQALWADFFKRYDVLLTPVSSTVAFPHDHTGDLLSRSFLVNEENKQMIETLVWAYMAVVSGLPATVAPVELSRSGLAVGVQIIGASFEDRTTIDLARGLSELVGGFKTPPGYKN